MSTNSLIFQEQQDGTLKGIYCHWDGYLQYNGVILSESYSDPKKLAKLLELGDLSSLGEESETSEAVRLYGFSYYVSEAFKALSDEEQERLKNEDHSGKYTVAYHRDRGEELKPLKSITLEEQMNGEKTFPAYCEYIYVQDKNGVWYVNSIFGDKMINGRSFTKLEEKLKELEK
jgi:hypothetical protein